MKVKLKLFADLANCLPTGAEKNEAEVECTEGTTILELLDSHNVPRTSCHLVLLNGVFQPPVARGQATLSDGDVVAVWPPVAGG